jgi:hypothetical protein
MNPDLEVDTDDLRRAASALAATADETAAGTTSVPAAQLTPRWHTTDAAVLAAEAARQQLAVLGEELAEAARQVAAAAEAYAEADACAATRLRLTR